MSSSGSGPAHAIDRRGLLRATAAGALALTGLPARAAAQSDPGFRADVVVVGAGFAGLSAARELARAGRSVLVLEARNRVGGRVVNRWIPGGEYVEAGGTYIGPTQDRMLALARDYGLATYPTYDTGRVIMNFGGDAEDLDAAVQDYEAIISRLETLSQAVDPSSPWRTADAREWDSQTFQTWLDANAATDGGKAMLTAAGHTLWGAEPRDLSLLFVLFYIAAAGNETTRGSLRRLLGISGAAQELRFVEGSQRLAQLMAEELGERVILSAPVRSVLYRGDGVEVLADGRSATAERVIIALPPALAGAIRYEPALPEMRAQLFQRRPMGSLVKCQAVYETPFWRADGLSGESLTVGGTPDITFDNTPEAGAPGVLVGFVGGESARGWSSRPLEARRQLVLDAFAAVVGPDALTPIDYFEVDWSNEAWSRGGPVAFAPPGVLLDYGATIREPVGPIHWAGTETATFWNGYMEGAVRSGERAAKEVLEALQ